MGLYRFDSSCLLGVLGILALVGCGTVLPPKELVSAREAFDRAKAGPAAELAPAELDTAEQALRAANYSFQEDGDSQATKDLAYIAHRRAMLAEAAGGTEAAMREKAQAEKDYREMTTEELAATRKKLDSERNVAERDRQLAARDRAEAQRQLEEERKARQAAEKQLAAALASLQKIASVKEEKRGVVITLSGAVLFATGKYELLPIARNKLDQVAKAVEDQGYKKIIVEGHTDSRGSAQMNETLSLKRAESVRTYLVSRGIDSTKISAVDIGEVRPVASNSTAEGRANNRRVELIVTPEK
jgi:outer membrane protein OmpA-like peptidoglycan-associated protein